MRSRRAKCQTVEPSARGDLWVSSPLAVATKPSGALMWKVHVALSDGVSLHGRKVSAREDWAAEAKPPSEPNFQPVRPSRVALPLPR